MEVDEVSKSYLNLEEIIKKETKAECNTAGKMAKESCSKVKLQREKLEEILQRLDSTSVKK